MTASTPAANNGSSRFDGINIYWDTKEIDGVRVPEINAFYLKGRMAEFKEQYGLPTWTKGTRYTLPHMDALKRMIADFRMERRKAEKGAYYEYVATTSPFAAAGCDEYADSLLGDDAGYADRLDAKAASAYMESLGPDGKPDHYCAICDRPLADTEAYLCEDEYCAAEYAEQVDQAGRIAAGLPARAHQCINCGSAISYYGTCEDCAELPF